MGLLDTIGNIFTKINPIAGIASSIISGLSGASQTRETNETNYEIAKETNAQNAELQRETNAQNERLFNQSLAWQEDMWNKQNAYNDPSHMVELLQKAGINPAAVFGNGSATPAGAVGSASPPVMGAAHMQGVQMQPVDYSWLSNIVDPGVNAFLDSQIKYNTIKKSAADAKISEVQAEFDALTMINRAARIANDTSKSEFERDTARMELRFLTTTFQDRVMQQEWITKTAAQSFDETVNRIEESKLRQQAQRIANQYAPQMAEAELKSYQASVASAYAAARASDAAALDSAAHAAVNRITEAGIKLDNNQKRAIASSLISEAQERAKQAKEQTKQMQSKTKSGEVRTRLIGAEPQHFEISNPFKLPSGLKKIDDAYKRGVKKGMTKKKKVSSW